MVWSGDGPGRFEVRRLLLPAHQVTDDVGLSMSPGEALRPSPGGAGNVGSAQRGGGGSPAISNERMQAGPSTSWSFCQLIWTIQVKLFVGSKRVLTGSAVQNA